MAKHNVHIGSTLDNVSSPLSVGAHLCAMPLSGAGEELSPTGWAPTRAVACRQSVT